MTWMAGRPAGLKKRRALFTKRRRPTRLRGGGSCRDGRERAQRPARPGLDTQAFDLTRFQPGQARHRNHRPHCRCRTRCGDSNTRTPCRPASICHALREHAVGAHAAGDDQRVEAGLLEGAQDLATSVSTIASCAAQAMSALRWGVSSCSRAACRTAVFRPEKLNSRPGRSSIGRGSFSGPGLPLAASFAELRPTRIRQAEQLGRLVEGLARGIVPGFAERGVAADPLHFDELGVAARHQQRHVRERRRLRLQQRREQMPFEVMDADRRLAPGVGEAPSERGAGQQCADQAGTGGVRHPVQLGRANAGLVQSGANERQQAPNVIPGRQFGNDAPEDAMQVDLAEKLVGQQPPIARSRTATALSSQEDSMARTRMDGIWVEKPG